MLNNDFPAFPCPEDASFSRNTGMTLREYYAGQALAGMTAAKPDWTDRDNVAKWAWAYADAMLKERYRG